MTIDRSGLTLMQWLDEMEQHSDVAVRGGVKLTGNMCSICRRKSDGGGRKPAEGAVY